MSKAAIGIDIGGTKISVTLGTEKGKILAEKRFSTPLYAQAKKAHEILNDIIADFLKIAKLKNLRVIGIGIGLPGAVNDRSGKVPYSPNMPGWENLPLKNKIKKRFRLPVISANDANAAACAEKFFGTAKNNSDFVYITVSTGIGSGVFVNGKLVEGAGFSAGEIGHISVVDNGNRCGCGRIGCLEAQSSGTAIAKIYSKLTGRKVAGAKDVSDASVRGDAKAKQAFEMAGNDFGAGLAIVMNVLNPELIVLGGGVFNSPSELFLKRAMKRCEELAWSPAFKSCQVKKSILKGHVGDLGALSIVFLNSKL